MSQTSNESPYQMPNSHVSGGQKMDSQRLCDDHIRRIVPGYPFPVLSWPWMCLLVTGAIVFATGNWCKEKLCELFGRHKPTHFGFTSFGPAVRVFMMLCHDFMNSLKQ